MSSTSKLANLENELNPAQFKAVTYQRAPLLVQAGPGTGKTRVLSYRIAWLLQSDPTSRILAITFTNKAAAEISSRIHELADKADRDRVQVSTFHGWALSFLGELGSRRDVIGQSDAVNILGQVLREEGIKGSAARIYQAVSAARQHYPPKGTGDVEDLSRILELYRQALERLGLWDFDELLIAAIQELERPEHRELFSKRFSTVLVDEFQDVSPAQYRLLQCMVDTRGDITVIGDPNQAIYGFRGASPEFLSRFCSDFHGVQEITLTAAYRCPQLFLDAARLVIGKKRAPHLESTRGRGPEIVLKPCRDIRAEARWIALEIEKNVGGLSFDSMNAGRAGGDELRSLDDVAVLFRTRRIGEAVASALFEEGIPFQMSAAPDPLDHPEIRQIWRVWEALKGRCAEYHFSRLPGRRERWVNIANTLKSAASRLGPDELISTIAKALEIDTDMPEVAGLMAAAARRPDIDSLAVLLRDEVDIIREQTEAVSLLSLHASKGLEFPIVFIAGCDDETLPWKASPLDEEERLFYVGLTRASERLYLTYPRKRMVNGSLRSRRISRFIKRIPKEMRVVPTAKKTAPRKSMKQRQKSLF